MLHRRGGSSEESDSYFRIIWSRRAIRIRFCRTTTPSAEAAATPPKHGGELCFLFPRCARKLFFSRPSEMYGVCVETFEVSTTGCFVSASAVCGDLLFEQESGAGDGSVLVVRSNVAGANDAA